MSNSDSPSSSEESSPNPTRRFLPLHILRKLSPSKQELPVVSDSDSDHESVPLPTSYYTSPSRPEKRRHLTVPSPRMAELSIRGHTRRFQSSIPGYGQGTKKTIRVSAARLNREGSTSTTVAPLSTRGSKAIRRMGMSGAIPVSDPGFPDPPLASPTPPDNFRPTEGRVVQRLFVQSPQQPDAEDRRQHTDGISPKISTRSTWCACSQFSYSTSGAPTEYEGSANEVHTTKESDCLFRVRFFRGEKGR